MELGNCSSDRIGERSSEKIDVIILAGGLGTRLKGMFPDLPKALSPVNGRPFLDYILDFLEESGAVNNVILAVGYMAEQIIEIYAKKREYKFGILFSREETQLGTGGAIKRALQYVTTYDVLTMNGDSYIGVSVKDLIAFHKEKNAAMTIVMKEIDDPGRYGLIEFDNNYRISSFNEKQTDRAKGYINTGLYLFKKYIFNEIEKDKKISLEQELIPLFIDKSVYGFIARGKFIDIGIPETYLITAEFFHENNYKTNNDL